MDTTYQQAIALAQRWLAEAVAADMPEPTAMNLATSNAAGNISSRTVLVKQIDEEGFVFYTNTNSRKGHELAERQRAALCFVWLPLARQIRVEGDVHQISDEQANAYFATRPRGSQIGAWASRQSHELESRAQLVEAVATIERKYTGVDVPRPTWWSGYRVEPDLIEFWQGREHRLHDRDEYRKTDDGWAHRLLYP